VLAASTVVHAWLLVGNVFGEQDAARLANWAIIAAAGGAYHGADYTAYSSPLYLEALRAGLQMHWLTPGDLPWFMSILSLIAAAGATAAMFGVVYQITRSGAAAVGAALLIQVAPVFWFNASYGFPSMVSLALFLAGLFAWQLALNLRQAAGRFLLGGAALLILLLASAVKLDALMAGALYCLPIWLGNQTRRSKLSWTGILLLAGAAIFVLVNAYGKYLAPVEQGAFSWNTWENRFPITAAALFSRINLLVMIRAGGLLAIPAGLVAAFLLGREARGRTIVLWLALAALPLTLFWGLRFGNSARHILIPVVVLYMLLALPLAQPKGRTWAGVLAAICLVNYLAFAASPDTVIPSGRLLGSTQQLEQWAGALHARGALIAERPEARLAVIGNGWEQPYFQYESLRRADPASISYRLEERGGLMRLNKGYGEQTVLWIYASPDAKTLEELARDGYLLLIDDRSLLPVVQQTPALAGQWLAAP
jgi:hypothetical protein